MMPKQNALNVLDDIFKCISFNENIWIAIRIPLKFIS